MNNSMHAKLETKHAELYYADFHALKKCYGTNSRKIGNCFNRSIRMWKIHFLV